MEDLKRSNYQGFIAIEPHIGKVFHLNDQKEMDAQRIYNLYKKYGLKFEKRYFTKVEDTQ